MTPFDIAMVFGLLMGGFFVVAVWCDGYREGRIVERRKGKAK